MSTVNAAALVQLSMYAPFMYVAVSRTARIASYLKDDTREGLAIRVKAMEECIRAVFHAAVLCVAQIAATAAI